MSLSGAGFLGAFHLGFAEALLKSGIQRTHRVEIAGASAGALVGTVIATETSLSVARDVLRELASRARGAGPLGILTPGFSLVEAVQSSLDEHLPSDAAQRASEARFFVALNAVESGKTHYVTSWSTRDELIECVCASSDIPGVTGLLRATTVQRDAGTESGPTTQRTPLQRWLNRDDVDGGLFDLHPDPWRVEAAGTAASALSGAANQSRGAMRRAVNASCAAEDAGCEVHFVSPFSGGGLAVAPLRPTTGVLSLPVGHGRTADASAANLVRALHALRPPSDSVLAAYEAEGFASAEKFFLNMV